MCSAGIDLLVFAGGDGTARDILDAIGNGVPVLGIPTGVKLHSAVFARHPRAAADLIVRFLTGQSVRCREAEVMDIDEDAYRRGALSAKLYGYLNVPFERGRTPGLKAGSPGGEEAENQVVRAVRAVEVEHRQKQCAETQSADFGGFEQGAGAP